MSEVKTAKVTWGYLDWTKVRTEVFRIQKRIYKAAKEGDFDRVKNLQKLVIRSRSAKLLATRMVTQDNTGAKTLGVDGIICLKPSERLALAERLEIDGKASPLKRVCIPKPDSEKGLPLGIPTIEDRAKQALAKIALEPEWEAFFEPNSYGFRPGKSAIDAIEGIRIRLRYKPKYVLDAEIAGFDRLDHEQLLNKLNTFSIMRRQIKAWLKAGVMKGNVFPQRDKDTPESGVIGPLLANIALQGLETEVNRIQPQSKSNKDGSKTAGIVLIQYADGFVVIHDELEKVQQAKTVVEQFLEAIGLKLSEEKTRICNTKVQTDGEEPGFDFLGYNFIQKERGKHRGARKPDGKHLGHRLITGPSEDAVKKQKTKLKHELTIASRMVKDKRTLSIVSRLKPIMREWAQYFRWGNGSYEAFNSLDETLYYRLLSLTKRDCGKQSLDTQWKRYWHKTEQGWRYGGYDQNGNLVTLPKYTDFSSRVHEKVRGEKSPFDGDWVYWSKRGKHDPSHEDLRQKLVGFQKGCCSLCGEVIFTGQDLELHHIDGNHRNNKRSNLAMVHRYCHQDHHSRGGSTIQNEEPDEAKVSSPVLEAGTCSNAPI